VQNVTDEGMVGTSQTQTFPTSGGVRTHARTDTHIPNAFFAILYCFLGPDANLLQIQIYCSKVERITGIILKSQK